MKASRLFALGIGLLPFPFLISPLLVSAMSWDDIGESLRNTVNGISGNPQQSDQQFNDCPNDECVNTVKSQHKMRRDGAVEYGSGDALSDQQLFELDHLAFPQSYEAIKSRLGFPHWRSGQNDYYRLESGNYITIRYSRGKAVGKSAQ